MMESTISTHPHHMTQFLLRLHYQDIPSKAIHHLCFPVSKSSRHVPLSYLSSAILSPLPILFLRLSPQLSTPALLLSQFQSSPTSCKRPIFRVTRRCIGR